MKVENKEIFIPGPSGRIQAKYFKSKKLGAPIALVLSPHPQYGGTMNNRIVYEAYNAFYKNIICFLYNSIIHCSSILWMWM